jgi:hypothetical protein
MLAETRWLAPRPGILDFGESFVDLLGDLDGAIAITFVQQEAQFVAAESCQQIAGPGHATDLIGNDAQQGIASLVPTDIVDILELVQVEIEQGAVMPQTTGAEQAPDRVHAGNAAD